MPESGGEQRIQAATITVPEGGGAVRGLTESLDFQAFTGVATLSIPLPAPPIRGFGPDLSLMYSSAGGNGPFGMGFALSLPSVTRRTTQGIPRYNGDDIFVLTGEGDLVQSPVPDTTADPLWTVTVYRPRRESTFALIERWTSRVDGRSHWCVRGRDNTVCRYGLTDDARIFDPANPDHIFEWLPEEIEDSRGNKIRFGYKVEDDAGVPPTIYEQGRDHRSNRYIARVEFGNYIAGGVERFCCSVRFDYGEYSLADPDTPPGDWIVRPDPFSSYRSGFEIRTLRRCRAILVYHQFHDQFDGDPFLVRALELDYGRAGPGLSVVRRVIETGFRRRDDGGYLRTPYPPLELDYSPFEPDGGHYRPLVVEGKGSLPGYLAQGQYLLADLGGQGLPGLLYSDEHATLFWEPLGGGRFAGPIHPSGFPIDGSVVLTSLRANGQQDLVVNAPQRPGCYPSDGAGSWQPFRPFLSAPTDLGDTRTQLVDMTGAGRADIALLERETIRTWPSLGLNGYGPAEQAPSRLDFPVSTDPDERELLTFADMFGDGLSHRVRIRDGELECWPNLGYGRFDRKVTFGNAPRFGGGVNPSRVFLADLDGSGPADLIHVRRDGIAIYFNCSGNTFSDPLEIPLPVLYDQLSQISFADVYGNGSACLILTQLTPSVDHFVYDFCRDTKPYLLTGVTNQLGSTVEIEYTSSVTQYLEDRREGREWATRLYFPVQVVTRVIRTEEITATRYVTRYRHHDGYYDPQYRQFQGFGFVETWDTEEFPDFAEAARAGRARALEERLYVPPVYTRTWFHTGAFLDAGVISAQYATQYWQGDPDAWVLPDSTFGPGIDQDVPTLRQAYAALAGSMLRQEVYGLDGTPQQADPYTVQENRYAVRMIQPVRGRNAAVFLTYRLETLSSNYDRVPADPRVSQEVALEVDEFGNVSRACTVAYPRREAPDRPTVPEQRRLMATLTEIDYANHVQTYRWIGIPVQCKVFELGGLSSSDKLFTMERLRSESDAALAAQIPFGQPFTPGLRQARVFAWDRAFYWDGALSAALPLGEISARGLIHHQEKAVLPRELVGKLYADKGDPDELMRGAGYAPAEGYWWNRGLIQYYLDDPAACFLPCRTDGLFAGVDPDGPLNPATSVDFDAYYLLPVAVTRHLTGAISLPVRADNDYQVMLPWRVIDINDNTTEVAFDPLGVVVVSTTFGTEDGVGVGDDPLSDYVPVPDATFQSVVDDPARYVQNAAAYFFYDLFAWALRGQPPSAIGIRRWDYVHAEPGAAQSLPQTGITYSDGLGRIVENRLRTEPVGQEQRWIVSGQVTYNNKGAVTERYLPYFSSSPDYAREPGLLDTLPPPTVLHYDPLGRQIRTDTPKGFFAATAYSPWAVTAYDEDDTVLDSPFYQHFPAHGHDAERAALDMAARFYNTPSVTILDVAGRTVRELVNNLGVVSPADLAPIVAGSGITPWELWDELVADGYLTVDTIVPERAWVAAIVAPYDPEFRVRFTERFGDLAAPLLNLLKDNGLTTLRELDSARNPVRQVDPRLLYTNVTTGTDYTSLRTSYDMAANPLVVRSADAGDRWCLPDVFGSPIETWDGRGYRITRTFDRLARPVRVEVAPGGATAEVTEYGEAQPDPAQRNLNGQVYRQYDSAGLVTDHAYTLTGRLASTTRQVRADHDRPADWTPAAMAGVAGQPAYSTRFGYDALDHLTRETAPNATVRVLSYNIAGQFSTATVEGPLETVIVESVEYDAVGQRTTIRYGNGTRTGYSYEDTTLRLAGIITTKDDAVYQDVRYTFDPVGNVTHIENRSWESAFCHPQPISPASDYDYDALYRLLRSTGRKAVAGGGPSSVVPFCPAQPEAELEDYVQRFGYDDSGNLVLVEDVAPVRAIREFDIAPDSNRLATIPYDANGNPLALGDLGALEWNYAGALTRIELPGGAGEERCLYDSANARVLRVEPGGAATVYVGSYQESGGKQVASLLDDRTRVCLVEHDVAAEQWALRYQLADNLGSVAWELDASGAPLNYQEYFAYGASAFLAAGDQAQADGKEFRFSGKELDAAAGLYYYGVRYYSPEFGRWLSPDPAGAVDGLNLYAFVAGNPVSKIDNDGSVGFWAIWGAYVIGALVTMVVGAYGGYRLGHGRGIASGIFMGSVAGASGAVAAAGTLLATGGPTPTLESIAMVAAFSVIASIAGSVVGGPSGGLAMRVTPGTNNRAIATVGFVTSAAIGGALGFGVVHQAGGGMGPSTLISIAAGLGSAVLSSGSPLGFLARGTMGVNAVPLSYAQRAQIRPAQPVLAGVPVAVRNDRLLLVIAPQAEAERRYASSFQNQPDRAYVLDPATGPGPGIKDYHVVAVHGFHGSVLVSTGPSGDTMRPMSIGAFARYVAEQLAGFADNVPIKFISCFGASTDPLTEARNAQVLADVTGRKVWAFFGPKDQAYAGPWYKFRPRP